MSVKRRLGFWVGVFFFAIFFLAIFLEIDSFWPKKYLLGYNRKSFKRNYEKKYGTVHVT